MPLDLNHKGNFFWHFFLLSICWASSLDETSVNLDFLNKTDMMSALIFLSIKDCTPVFNILLFKVIL